MTPPLADHTYRDLLLDALCEWDASSGMQRLAVLIVTAIARREDFEGVPWQDIRGMTHVPNLSEETEARLQKAIAAAKAAQSPKEVERDQRYERASIYQTLSDEHRWLLVALLDDTLTPVAARAHVATFDHLIRLDLYDDESGALTKLGCQIAEGVKKRIPLKRTQSPDPLVRAGVIARTGERNHLSNLFAAIATGRQEGYNHYMEHLLRRGLLDYTETTSPQPSKRPKRSFFVPPNILAEWQSLPQK